MKAHERENLIEWIIAYNGKSRSDYDSVSDTEIEVLYNEIREKALQDILEEMNS